VPRSGNPKTLTAPEPHQSQIGFPPLDEEVVLIHGGYTGSGFPEGKDIGDGRQSQAVSIGEVLAEARHRRGLTVAEVSHYTRVREPVIRAIERDDFLLPGSDAATRDQIRLLARALGVDPGPLISEFDTSYRSAPELDGTEAVRSTIPFRVPFRIRGLRRRRRVSWRPVLALLVLAVIGGTAYYLVSGRVPAFGALGRSSPGHPAGSVAPASARGGDTVLAPASVVAFGPDGPADGDNPQLASRAIDGNPATAWTTDWYGMPRFANVQGATGLLLDMGRPVTITGAGVTLGRVPGADFQLRVGNKPSLADLSEVAIATDASGAMGVRLSVPVYARYVLLWFTALPPSGTGTYQASVYNISVLGVKRPLSGRQSAMPRAVTARDGDGTSGYNRSWFARVRVRIRAIAHAAGKDPRL
jgi:transcriptional regulator with XRE-family HTH domain